MIASRSEHSARTGEIGFTSLVVIIANSPSSSSPASFDALMASDSCYQMRNETHVSVIPPGKYLLADRNHRFGLNASDIQAMGPVRVGIDMLHHSVRLPAAAAGVLAVRVSNPSPSSSRYTKMCLIATDAVAR
jgi:hypothetical protein